ncbi:MAG: 3-oxoacyl-[acyl-carrier-protein] synthase III C-terminal domain-containing protein [Myxococcota bacterium]
MNQAVYVSGLGSFFPGPCVSNDEMEAILGRVHGQPSRTRARVLAQNGIVGRHYALDGEQRSTHRASEMAALAVGAAFAASTHSLSELEFLAAATTQGDVNVPGFASMVHAELAGPACEIASLQGVCASGMMALKSAYLQIKSGEKRLAVACASEFPSRFFKASRYEPHVAQGTSLPFDVEFLRWMLSDGAGAALLSREPSPRGMSLRLEWLELTSYAHLNPVCMYAGAQKRSDGGLGPGWLDYPNFEAAAAEGAMYLRQDVRLLDRIVKLGVDGVFALAQSGRLDVGAIDHVVCHYSSHVFKEQIFALLDKAGLVVPEHKWFTNLYTRGNVGSASIYVLLDELMRSGRVQPGQTVFAMIPESGRFVVSYALFTVVAGAAPLNVRVPEQPALETPVAHTRNPVAQALVRDLTRVWIDFEARLLRVPIVEKLESMRFTLEDYKTLLVNLRQQVVEGSRWIARAASRFDGERYSLRSLALTHARDEHRDFELLERDFVSIGGSLAEIRSAPKNIGSEALSAFMFQRADQENPIDLLGAMFIIEGLGQRLAGRWGRLIQDQLGLEARQVSFLLYHSENDDRHLGKLDEVLNADWLDAAVAARIVKTAKVTARLYRLQLDELGQV